MSNKKCSKCGEVKLLNEFHRNKKGVKGRVSRCKSCMHKGYMENREAAIEYSKKYKAANKDKVAASNRAYKLKHKEVIREQARQYHIENRDERLAYGKAYHVLNREKVRSLQRKYYDKIKDDLNDTYIGKLLTSASTLTRADIPPEFIELKRAQLKLKQKLKEMDDD